MTQKGRILGGLWKRHYAGSCRGASQDAPFYLGQVNAALNCSIAGHQSVQFTFGFREHVKAKMPEVLKHWSLGAQPEQLVSAHVSESSDYACRQPTGTNYGRVGFHSE